MLLGWFSCDTSRKCHDRSSMSGVGMRRQVEPDGREVVDSSSYSSSDSESSFREWEMENQPRRKNRAGSRSSKIDYHSRQFSRHLLLRLVCIFLILFLVCICTELDRSWDPRIYMYGGKFQSGRFSQELSDVDDTYNSGFVPAITMIKKKRAVELPSLNLLDYEESSVFPIFPGYKEGINREDMPQLPFNKSGRVWAKFRREIIRNGGTIGVEEDVDLREAIPLQAQLSGFIVYNILFGDGGWKAKGRLDNDGTWFSKRIVLIRTPGVLQSVDGSIIQKDSWIILDGHHTTAVAKLCAESPHTHLRLGNYNPYILKGSACGQNFNPKQEILIINGLQPLKVRELAITAGAAQGHSMIHHAHP